MSRRPNGRYMCDRCGIDVGNGGVIACSIMSDLYADSIRVLHFCRTPNDGAPDGCAAHLLVPSNLAAWNAANPPDPGDGGDSGDSGNVSQPAGE